MFINTFYINVNLLIYSYLELEHDNLFCTKLFVMKFSMNVLYSYRHLP